MKLAELQAWRSGVADGQQEPHHPMNHFRSAITWSYIQHFDDITFIIYRYSYRCCCSIHGPYWTDIILLIKLPVTDWLTRWKCNFISHVCDKWQLARCRYSSLLYFESYIFYANAVPKPIKKTINLKLWINFLYTVTLHNYASVITGNLWFKFNDQFNWYLNYLESIWKSCVWRAYWGQSI